MRSHAVALLSEMEARLQIIHADEACPLLYAPRAVAVLEDLCHRLEDDLASRGPVPCEDEIFFFKTILPKPAGKLLYYERLHALEALRPVGSGRAARRHYKEVLRQQESFFAAHQEFYRYLRTGGTYLDSACFQRCGAGPRARWSGAAAEAQALGLLSAYAEGQLRLLRQEDCGPEPARDAPALQWTAPKAALVELAYALHADGAVQQGNASLAAIMGALSAAFGTEPGQYHRTYIEIRARKGERAAYLERLRAKLLGKMDDADGAL